MKICNTSIKIHIFLKLPSPHLPIPIGLHIVRMDRAEDTIVGINHLEYCATCPLVTNRDFSCSVALQYVMQNLICFILLFLLKEHHQRLPCLDRKGNSPGENLWS
jgi:hypothetical protein